MTPFPFVVLTPREAVFDGEVRSVTLLTADGSVGFLSGREKTTVEVLPGDLTFVSDDGTRTIETDGGVAEMTGKTLTVLCGAAYFKEEAEQKKAERLEELSEEKRRQEKSLAEYKINRAALIRAFEKIRRTKVK